MSFTDKAKNKAEELATAAKKKINDMAENERPDDKPGARSGQQAPGTGRDAKDPSQR